MDFELERIHATARPLVRCVAELSRGFDIEKKEVGLLDHFVDVVGRCFPQWQVAARLTPAWSNQVTHWGATDHPLKGEARQRPVRLAPQGFAHDSQLLAKAREHLDLLPPEAPYDPVFANCHTGIALPLLVDQQCVGALNIESPSPELVPFPEMDSGTVLAQMLARAVCNRRRAVGLRFLHDPLAKVIDDIDALVWIADEQGVVRFFNHSLGQLTGLSPQAVLDKDLLALVPEAERAEVGRQWSRVVAGEVLSGCEIPFAAENGEVIRTSFNLTRLLAPDEEGHRVIAVGQNTATIQLLENQVIHAEKLATLGKLAAGVVHEINNPLTSVTVYADYLFKKFKGQEAAQADLSMLDKILEGSNRILKCTRDLVDYAKPSGKRSEWISLNDVVTRSLSFCEHVIEESQVTVEQTLAEELPPLLGVQDQLQQVFVNLITNACHAMGDRGGVLKVVTTDLKNGQLSAEVGDTGSGIQQEDLVQVFDPFFTTKRPGEGTGLGLSIVKKIVDFHGGSILVKTTPKKGTTFTVMLPLDKKQQAQ